MKLEKYRMTDIVAYYIEYLMEQGIADSKEEAKALFLNAITYNVVREGIVNQAAFLKEEC